MWFRGEELLTPERMTNQRSRREPDSRTMPAVPRRASGQ